MEQNFKSLEQKANEELEDKGLTDMIINNKITIEEYVGTTPIIPSIGHYNDLASIEERTEEFNKTFYGEGARIEGKFVEGKIPKFKDKVKTYLFGGIKKEVVEGKKGLQEEGTEIYQEATETLKEIKKSFPQIRKGINMQEGYQNKLKAYIKKHSEIFHTCEIKNKKINEIIEGMEAVANNENESTERIKKANDVLKKLYDQKTRVLQTINIVTQKTNIYDENLQYVKHDVGASRDIYSNLEIKINGFEANMELFKGTIDTIPITVDMYTIGTKIDKLSENLRETMSKMHEMKIKNLELNREQLEANRELGMYNKDQVIEMQTEGERFNVIKKSNEQEILNKARAVFYKNK